MSEQSHREPKIGVEVSSTSIYKTFIHNIVPSTTGTRGIGVFSVVKGRFRRVKDTAIICTLFLS